MKLSEFFTLSWKKVWIVVVGAFLSIVIHNAFYGLFGLEEPVFFILAVFVFPGYFIISSIYSLIKWIKLKKYKRK